MIDQTKYIIQTTFDAKGVTEFEISQARVTQIATQLGRTLNGVSSVIKDQAKIFKTTKGDFEKHTITFRDLNGQMQMATGVFKNVNGQWVLMSNGANLASASIGKLSTGSLSLFENLGRLAGRALLTIPVWLALRSTVMGVINTITELKKVYKDLEEGMAKVMAVAQYTSDTQARVYADLEQKARQYYAVSTAGMKDITEAMYELGSAGRSNEEMMSSLKPIMDLAIGSYTDVKTIARAVAGVLNVFGEEFKNVGTKEEQLTYITNLLGDSWRRHQIEVSEVVEAYKYLGATGAATGIDFKTFLAAVGNLGDEMLRSGKAGRNLSSAISDMSKNADKMKDLGLKFDPRGTMDFVDLMTQLKVIYEAQGQSLATNAKMQEIFGEQGARAIVLLLEKWESFMIDLDRTPDKVDKVGESLRKLREHTWGGIFTRMFRLATTGPSTGTGASPLKDELESMVQGWEQHRIDLTKTIELYKKFGNQLKLTKEEASAFAGFLITKAGQTKEGYSLLGKYGLTGLLTPKTGEEREKLRGNVITQLQELAKQEAKIKLDAENKVRTVEQAKQVKKERVLSADILQKIEDTEKLSQKEEMLFKGYTEEEIVLKDINDWIEKQNKNVDLRVNKQFTINDLLNQNVQALVDAGLADNTIIEGLKKVEEYQKAILKDAKEYADILSTSITESLEEIMGGSGIGTLVTNLNETLVTSYRKEMASGISKMFMATGIGNIFSGSLLGIKSTFSGISGKIENAFDVGGKITYDWIVRGFADAQTGMGGLVTAGTASWGGSSASIIGGSLASQGTFWAGATGNYQPVVGNSSKVWVPTNNYGQKGWKQVNKSTLAGGQIVTGGAQAALTGYSAYQSASAGGLGMGGSIASGVLAAGGATAGLIGTMAASTIGGATGIGGASAGMASVLGLTMGPVGWAMLGVGLALAAMIPGLMGGAGEQFSSQTATNESRISSKIDITNKNLEVINRNLIALKNSVETYILPSSAYFSTKSNTLEDQWSLMATRGLLG